MKAIIQLIRIGAFSIHFFLFCLPITAIIGQSIDKVRVSFNQSQQVYLIDYEINDLKYTQRAFVTPYLIKLDSNTEILLTTHLYGDYGWISSGKKKRQIRWDPFREGAYRQLDNLQIGLKPLKIQAEPPNRAWGIGLHGSNVAPFGFKVVHFNRLGFFASFRMIGITPAYKYTADQSGLINYRETLLYEIGTRTRSASFSVTAGPIVQIGRKLYGFAGLGYGRNQQYWEYNQFEGDQQNLNAQWALNQDVSAVGLSADIGIAYRIGNFFMDIGASSIQLESYQWIGSIGWVFRNIKTR